jgi:hypothetical protein
MSLLVCDPEDGSIMFLSNLGGLDYTAAHPTRYSLFTLQGVSDPHMSGKPSVLSNHGCDYDGYPSFGMWHHVAW